MKNGLKNIGMLRGNYSGRRLGAEHSATLVGRMKVSPELVTRRKAQKKHRLYHCPEWNEIRLGISDAFSKWQQEARTSKKEWKWQRGIITHPLVESRWNRVTSV